MQLSSKTKKKLRYEKRDWNLAEQRQSRLN